MLPYQRPPLSKQYLSGLHTADWLLYRPARFYENKAVDVRLRTRAVAIDRARRSVTLHGGNQLPYDKLALATGARARKLYIPGANHPHVYDIRTLEDVDKLRSCLMRSKRAVIIGAGFIGLETAAKIIQMGVAVTLLAAQDRLIPKFGASDLAQFLLDQHLQHGVHVVFNAETRALHAASNGSIDVVLSNGNIHQADIVLVGIGAIPNVELAQDCGLECDDGIVVDELARTNDPLIVAAGDCTNHPNPLLGRRIRLETVHNAVEQGRTAGATIAGVDLPYIQTPWVWSDQYQLRLQSVGLSDGYDHTVLRGHMKAKKFSVFFYKQSVLVAVNCINQPAIFGAVRRLLNERIPLSPIQAADLQFDIPQLPPRTARLDFDVPWPTKIEKQQRTVTWGHE